MMAGSHDDGGVDGATLDGPYDAGAPGDAPATGLSDATGVDMDAGAPMVDADAGAPVADAAADANVQGDGGDGATAPLCRPGAYVGTFSCGFLYEPDAAALGPDAQPPPVGAATPDASAFTISGTVMLSISAGSPTVTGTFASSSGISTITSTLSGTLDCSGGAFTGHVSGTYTLLGSFSGASIAGPANASYVDGSFADGTLLLAIPGQGVCPGSWSAQPAGDH
jgi:hypothetical protein